MHFPIDCQNFVVRQILNSDEAVSFVKARSVSSVTEMDRERRLQIRLSKEHWGLSEVSE
jgi:hypothetical protein